MIFATSLSSFYFFFKKMKYTGGIKKRLLRYEVNSNRFPLSSQIIRRKSSGERPAKPLKRNFEIIVLLIPR